MRENCSRNVKFVGLRPRGFSLDVLTTVSFLNIVTFLGVNHYILEVIFYLKLKMGYAISKLSANFKLVKLLKRVLKNATSFSDPRSLKDTVLFSCFSVIL